MALNAITLIGPTVDATEVYAKAIYAPGTVYPFQTFEALHGGLTSGEYTGVDGRLPAWAAQYGTFAQAQYNGFDQPEYVYAAQLGGGGTLGTTIDERVVLQQLTADVFIPWDASVVLFGVQAFFCQDATNWDKDITTALKREWWDYRVEFGGTNFPGLYGRLSAGRGSTDEPTVDPLTDDPGFNSEVRWRFVSKFGMAKAVQKGHNRVRVSVWTTVRAPDQLNAKVVVPTGGVWILAIR